MKIKCMLALFVAFITLSVSAQQDRSQRQRRTFPSNELIIQLKLTDGQVSALKENEKKFETAMQELRKKNNDRTKMAEAMKKVRTERLEAAKKELDAAQYVSFLEYESINSMSGMMGGQRQPNQGGQRARNNNFGGGNDFGDNFGN